MAPDHFSVIYLTIPANAARPPASSCGLRPTTSCGSPSNALPGSFGARRGSPRPR